MTTTSAHLAMNSSPKKNPKPIPSQPANSANKAASST